MIIKHPYQYINSNLVKWKLDTFFSAIFIELEREMNEIAKRYYSYESKDVAEDDLFMVIERTWLGLFNNAIIRSYPESITFQEFMVWGEDNKPKGRCDFLFSWGDYDILVEAKIYEFTNDWSSIDNKSFYEERKMKKLREVYFKEEEQYYTRKTLGMVLVFEWIRNFNQLEQAKKIMNEWGKNKDEETDFLALYYGTNRGLIVYGRVEELN